MTKVLELQLQHLSFQWISELISFRIDWFYLAVQGTLKSLFQHYNSKALILWCSAFYMVQLSHPYITTGKIIALTVWTFVGKVMSLPFTTLPRSFPSKEQVSFNFLAAVTICSDFLAQENKISLCFHIFPFYLPWSDGTRCHDLRFLNIWVLSQLFHSLLSPSSRGSLVPLWFLPLERYHLHIWGCWYFSWKSWFQPVVHAAWHFTWCTLHIS